jgi:hypothetical protein
MLVDLCKPALLYFVMSVISLMIIVVSGFPFLYVLIKIAFIAGWTWALNYICKKGYTVISWFFLIAPFVMMIIMTGFAEGLQRKTAN